jgi:hypothetical protein
MMYEKVSFTESSAVLERSTRQRKAKVTRVARAAPVPKDANTKLASRSVAAVRAHSTCWKARVRKIALLSTPKQNFRFAHECLIGVAA